MQHLVQKAIRDKLATDAALVAFLAVGSDGRTKAAPLNVGANNIFVEGDVKPTYPPPYVVLKYIRQRPGTSRNEFVQTWHIQIYSKDRGYFEIEDMETRVFNLFHEQTLSVDSACPFFCMNNGVQVIDSLRGYHSLFKTEYVAAVIDVRLMKRNA